MSFEELCDHLEERTENDFKFFKNGWFDLKGLEIYFHKPDTDSRDGEKTTKTCNKYICQCGGKLRLNLNFNLSHAFGATTSKAK